MNPTQPQPVAIDDHEPIPPHVKNNYVDCAPVAARPPRRPSPPPVTPPLREAR